MRKNIAPTLQANERIKLGNICEGFNIAPGMWEVCQLTLAFALVV